MQAPPEEFETGRLRLVRLRLSDAERVFIGWAQDPEVTRYLIWSPHKSLSESEAHCRRCEEAWAQGSSFAWILEDLGSGEALGSIAAHRKGHRVALGYLLIRSAWGQGYMTEAVVALTEWFMLQREIFRVWAVCDAENAASARVLERAGFEYEGRLARWLTHPNASPEPRDALCFAVSKP